MSGDGAVPGHRPPRDPPRDPPLAPAAAGALVFLASGAVLVLEILSLRLVAPYLGLSFETSTTIIGVALAAIAAGAWLGGRAADAVPPRRVLGPLLGLGGLLVLLVGPAVRATGDLARGAGAGGVLLVVTVAVFIPAALLSAVTPMIVKLQLGSVADTGRVVGWLSGLGTLGALVATFGTGFVLVAAVPASRVLLGLGAVLLAVAAVLSRRAVRRPAAAGAAAVLVGAAVLALVRPSPCDVETAYHCARIVADPDRPTGRVLRLDTARHSYVDLADPTHLEFPYVRAIAAVVDAVVPAGRPVDALHLGGGGATLPRWLAATRPGSRSLVFEIDPRVVAVDRERLGLRTGPALEVRVQDARLGLAEEPAGSRDVVVGDAFGGLAVPWHLTTREAVSDVRRALRPGGVYAMNVIDHPPLRFARAEAATLRAVFRHVAVLAPPDTLAGRGGGNLVLVASDAPLPLAAIASRLPRDGTGWAVQRDAAAFAAGARVLTDDFAPVDQLLTPYPRRPAPAPAAR